MKASLRTRDGSEFVAELEMPAFEILPDVVLWQARIYCLRRPFKKNPEMPAEYFEAGVWAADAPTDSRVELVYCPELALR